MRTKEELCVAARQQMQRSDVSMPCVFASSDCGGARRHPGIIIQIENKTR